MKRELLAATSLGTLAWIMSCEAHAQTVNWAGTYVGAELGASVNEISNAKPVFANAPLTGVSPNGPFSGFPAQVDLGRASPIGGLTFGSNRQFGALVVGVETDFSGLGSRQDYQLSSKRTLPDTAGNLGTRNSTFGVSTGTDWLYTIRPRAGVTFDRLLLFGTGGFALGGTHLSTSSAADESFSDPGKLAATNNTGSQRSFGSTNAVRAGYVAGAGAEYAITDHLSLKTEGLYYNLGTGQVAANGTSVTTNQSGFPIVTTTTSRTAAHPYFVRQRFDGVIARFGLNYKLP